MLFQEAVAVGFETEFSRRDSPDCLFTSLPRDLLPKRDKMAAFLSEVGMVPTIPEGGYFMIASTKDIGEENALKILMSEFYCEDITLEYLSIYIPY